MVYTVTLNPALDYVIHIEDFQTGEINRTQREEIQFGGKGCCRVHGAVFCMVRPPVTSPFCRPWPGCPAGNRLRRSGSRGRDSPSCARRRWAGLLTDLELERENPYEAVFSPSRTVLRPQLAANGLEAALSLLTPTAPLVNSANGLPAGTSQGKTKAPWSGICCRVHGAVFCMAANGLEAALSLLTPTVPRCPHMGCALKYNAAEHSWDCPCHGSR